MSVYLFAGQEHYPAGGVWDYQGRFEAVEAAKQVFDLFRKEKDKGSLRPFLWAHIANDNMEIIEVYQDGDRTDEQGEWELEDGIHNNAH